MLSLIDKIKIMEDTINKLRSENNYLKNKIKELERKNE